MRPPSLTQHLTSLRNFDIIHKIKPSESHLLLIPLFIGTAIDDGSNTTHDTRLAMIDSQKILRLAELKAGFLRLLNVFISSKRKEGNSKFIALIQFIIEVYEGTQSLSGCYWYYSYIAHYSFYSIIIKF